MISTKQYIITQKLFWLVLPTFSVKNNSLCTVLDIAFFHIYNKKK